MKTLQIVTEVIEYPNAVVSYIEQFVLSREELDILDH